MIDILGGRSLSEEEIRNVEQDMRVSFPVDYRHFVAKHDGAKPKLNIFSISESNESGINEFIPLHRIRKECNFIENLVDGRIPIAWAEGGNYVCLDVLAGGGVFFWDHEEPKRDTKLADSFSRFIELLEPFDPGSVELKPDQVKSAWIDPEFLKSLDQKK
ncbi:SMI1/KNR4 family protein [Alcanivorax sp. JB21]|uniref:SMI1/KNR4 family protein n=1 Tax=Alcanivorax limicola TaxID=2874102 RepID=UPI001CBC6D90|nr:SMI1/KNR4 family protein [Alcanivorax limicola]MBZ2188660.1 SMI1/KNR4 family protein [Alcanivorax limicola]MBZ2190590.1 SMI1/KNR4 family protein [Alcanivorax limicola]